MSGVIGYCPASFGSAFSYDRCLAETQDFECFRHDVATKFDFLSDKSVVVVIGAYKGENVELIASNSRPNFVLFEPIREFSQILRQKFSQYPNRVDVYDTAVGIANKTAFIGLDSDASSVVAEGEGDSIAIRVSTFDTYYADIIRRYGKIDLLYVNCEGCEYEVLTDILKHGWQEKIDRLLLQFHYQSDGYSKARCPLLHILSATHHREFSYPWVWEMWVRQSEPNRGLLPTVYWVIDAVSNNVSTGTIVITAVVILGVLALTRKRKAKPRRRSR